MRTSKYWRRSVNNHILQFVGSQAHYSINTVNQILSIFNITYVDRLFTLISVTESKCKQFLYTWRKAAGVNKLTSIHDRKRVTERTPSMKTMISSPFPFILPASPLSRTDSFSLCIRIYQEIHDALHLPYSTAILSFSHPIIHWYYKIVEVSFCLRLIWRSYFSNCTLFLSSNWNFSQYPSEQVHGHLDPLCKPWPL